MVQESDFTVPIMQISNSSDVDMIEPDYSAEPGISTYLDTNAVKCETDNWDLTKDNISPETEFLEDIPIPGLKIERKDFSKNTV